LLDLVRFGVAVVEGSLSQSLSVAAGLRYVESASSSSLPTFRFLVLGTSIVSTSSSGWRNTGTGVAGTDAAIGDMVGANDAVVGDGTLAVSASFSFSRVFASFCSRFDSFLRNLACF
jgi:hypothetical protein